MGRSREWCGEALPPGEYRSCCRLHAAPASSPPAIPRPVVPSTTAPPRHCGWCGKRLEGRHGNARYCTPEHGYLAGYGVPRPTDRTCGWCGVNISHMRPDAKYCTVNHRVYAHTNRSR